MNFSKLTLVLLFALISVVASGQSEDKATLYIVRTSGLGAAINFKYFIDDQFVGKTNYGKYFKFEVEVGEHVVWAKAENMSFIKATFEPGKTYVINAIPQMGAFKAGVYLKAINEPTEKETKKILKYISKKKLLEYDQEKRRMEQNDYADIIEKGMTRFKDRVDGSPELERLTIAQDFIL